MMRKRNFVLLIALVLLLTALAPAASARADNDDFSMTYDFYPGGVGYLGGYVRLVLLVKNEGTKNIDKVDVVINLKAGFSKRWTGTITPGAETKIVCDGIHFTRDDINKTHILQVAINNDGDANPDGVQMVNFTIPGAGTLYRLTYDLDPPTGTLHPGETLSGNIYIDNNNTADGMILKDLNVTIFINVDGGEDHTMPMGNLGDLRLGESATQPFSYTVGAEDITDRLRINCNLKYSMAGLNYSSDNLSSVYAVEEASRPTERPTERATATHTAEPATATPLPAMTHTAAPATATPLPAMTHTAAPATATPLPTTTAAASPSPLPAGAEAQPPPDTLTTVLMVLIGALLLAAVVLLVLLLLRRYKTKQQ